MKKIAFLILALFALGAGAVSPPKPAKSEYFISTGAGFAMLKEEGVHYAMNFALLKSIESPIYITALFENPEKGKAPFQKSEVVNVGASELSVKSERLTYLRNNRKYLVELRIFADEGKSVLLGKHKQEVLFSVPAQLVSELEAQFGIQIK